MNNIAHSVAFANILQSVVSDYKLDDNMRIDKRYVFMINRELGISVDTWGVSNG